jgi:hypothetical protein
MVVERPYEYFTIFDFYRDGERLRTDDIQHFRRALNQLLVKERPEHPNQPGAFLLLRKEVARYTRLQTFLRIADRLVSNGFKDEFNWVLEDKHDPVSWWTDRLAIDVVGLPAYSDKNGRNFLLKGNSWSYRLFTRPNYTQQDIINK